MHKAITRLAGSLAHTSLAEPRPVADLEIPDEVRKRLAQTFTRQPLKPAAVLVGVMPAEEHAGSVLLTRRSEVLKNHPGQISFPGGRQESSDATLDVTALRESHEEIALPADMVEVIGYLPDYPTITGYRVTPVVGLVESRAVEVMQPDGVEATELIELPLEVALDTGAYEKKLMRRHGIEVPVFHLHYGRHHVWGATAGMLYQLCLQIRRHENSKPNSQLHSNG